MKDVNKVLLMGRLGNFPVQRQTKAGLAVVHFSMATSRRLLAQEAGGEAKEETQWHRVVVWGKQAEACAQYLEKGQAVFVEGMIRTRKYTGKDGVVRYNFEVHADDVIFLGRKRGADSPEPGSEMAAVEVAAGPAIEEVAAA